MERRIADIESDLSPPREHDAEVKAALLAEMLLTFPTQGQASSEMIVKTKTRIYQEVLGDIPAWALRIALRAWYAGKVKDVEEKAFTWAPSPAYLRRASEDELLPYKEMLADLKLLLEVKPLDETIKELEVSTPRVMRSM